MARGYKSIRADFFHAQCCVVPNVGLLSELRMETICRRIGSVAWAEFIKAAYQFFRKFYVWQDIHGLSNQVESR
jgi:hypothetical protein